jgi:hypothetical protein
MTLSAKRFRKYGILTTNVAAPGLGLLRVKLLKTCGLWIFGNLLLDLLLLQNEPTDVGSYMRW